MSDELELYFSYMAEFLRLLSQRNNIFKSSHMVIKVRQRQYAIGFKGTETAVLLTHNIWTCTGFVGLNKQGVAFLAHFDGPFLRPMLSELINDLKAENVDFNSFDFYIVTGQPGRFMGWLTRIALRRNLKKLNLATSIPKTQYLARTLFWKGGIRVDSNSGIVTAYKYLIRPEYHRYTPESMRRVKLAEEESAKELEVGQSKNARVL